MPPLQVNHQVADPAPQQIFEPPQGPVLEAIGHNRGLVAVCAVVFCLIGVAVGFARQPVYTSSATLQVGQVNPNSPGFFGYVQSASGLATAFSRAIAAEPVLKSVERELSLPPAEAIPRLSSEPIPLSPAFRVIATGSSADAAMKLANATAEAVVVYESQSNSSNPEAKALLGEYQQASFNLHEAEASVEELESAPSGDEDRLNAEAARSAAKVKLQAIENAYVAAVTSGAPRRGLVSLLASATSASSDRTAKIELWGLLGLVAGLGIGCAAAVVRERRLVS
jgi:uncharacterized protein involved in exopolysaccharide biosynthesis